MGYKQIQIYKPETSQKCINVLVWIKTLQKQILSKVDPVTIILILLIDY